MAAEALALLVIAGPAVKLLPFRWLGAVASLPARGRDGPDAALPERVRWAVEAAARRLPWRPVCFPKGLVAQLMLRRRGVASTLYFGVGQDPVDGLTAHVWVRNGAQDVIGCDEAAAFAPLAAFPAPPR
jgi:hypothetical protein